MKITESEYRSITGYAPERWVTKYGEYHLTPTSCGYIVEAGFTKAAWTLLCVPFYIAELLYCLDIGVKVTKLKRLPLSEYISQHEERFNRAETVFFERFRAKE